MPLTLLRLLPALLLLACATQATAALPSFQQVRQDFRPSDTLVLDRNGELLQRVRTDASVRRGQWVSLADVSPALRQAMLLSEDKRFYEHSGVDWQAVSSAAWGNLWATRTRGASTITMQLAGLMDEDLQRRSSDGRDLQQKLGQAWAARTLEKDWRKDQILEAYLNTVPFRGEIVGIDALSRSLFAKAPHGLDAREAALAAALVRAPNAKPALVAQRGCELLRSMQPGSRTDCLALEAFANASLSRRDWPASEGIAPHLARRLLRQRAEPQAQIRSSLRAPLQRFALSTLQRHLRELRGRNVEDGAVVVLDNATGEVLAWVGSSGDALSRASEVDGVVAQRQPGSTLKPFLYAQAIAQRRLTAASLLDDSRAQISTAGGLYIPQNYDRHFKGPVSVRSALGASLNVPAVRTLVLVGPETFARQLRAAGIELRENGDYYGYSLALGSAEVSLLQLANAYRTLANGGRTSAAGQGLPVAAAPAFTQAIDPGASFIVGDILHDTNARAPTFGLDSVLATRFWTAVKTGTSKDMRDNWAVGWSSRYTVGVWVGNASGAPMWDVSGSSGAAPVWAELMAFLHRSEPSRPPAPPRGLLSMKVSFGDDLEAAREEWFVAGTEQPRFALDGAGAQAVDAAARISAPADGTIVALDPDIPPARQRLVFEAEGGSPQQQLQWRIDGRTAGQGARLPWLPWPGRHVVQLVDARQGAVLDQLRIEVRGAGVAHSR
ncbi:penicillin-binding protein 1C [Variovorax sp. OV329]|uniref:penicillin-binding protein 1C n=1 Tax=Variovorax sp. OV329 TaxID=1882825 RepID=UPI0008EEE6DF|nr:penicillin-binding protein 1C [Variovorax sp. OV329]SFM10980.1 penicillin-binding protein 1C [Variovorax sp. OV329]